MRKKSVSDLQDSFIRGRRALVRVDFNVPLNEDGSVGDDTRIRAALPTIDYLAERRAGVILFSHLGRAKGGPDPEYSTALVARHLATLNRRSVQFEGTSAGDTAVAASKALGEGNVLVLENT